MNGYIAEVGCRTLVFPDADTLLTELARYLASPDSVEREYLKKEINRPEYPLPCPAEELNTCPPNLSPAVREALDRYPSNTGQAI